MQFAPYKLANNVDWRMLRDSLATTVLRTLERYAPGLSSMVEHRQVLTPADLELTYGYTRGHILHGEPALDQLFTMRPLLGWAQYRTPIQGLFLCGAGTHPGGGITGAPGRNAAREIAKAIKNMKPRIEAQPGPEPDRGLRADMLLQCAAMAVARSIALLAVMVAACELPTPAARFPSASRARPRGDQLALEDRFLSQPDRSQLRDAHRELTRTPHPAGSARDRELADWTARALHRRRHARRPDHHARGAAPASARHRGRNGAAARVARVDARAADGRIPIRGSSRPIAGLPFHAYSASGDVTAPVVYAG